MNLKNELQIGQVVPLRTGRSYDAPYRFAKVVKITPTQVVLDNQERYMISNGYR